MNRYTLKDWLSDLFWAVIVIGVVCGGLWLAAGRSHGADKPLQVITEKCDCGKDCPCKEPCRCGSKLTEEEVYHAGYDRALLHNKNLLVWVNCKARTVLGCVSVRMSKFDGIGYPCCILGVPDGKGQFDWAAVYYAGTVSDKQIKAQAASWRAARAEYERQMAKPGRLDLR